MWFYILNWEVRTWIFLTLFIVPLFSEVFQDKFFKKKDNLPFRLPLSIPQRGVRGVGSTGMRGCRGDELARCQRVFTVSHPGLAGIPE